MTTQRDRAALSVREIADYLSTSVSMTQDVCMSRATNGVAAAAALTGWHPQWVGVGRGGWVKG